MNIIEILEMRKKSFEIFEKNKNIHDLNIPADIQRGYCKSGKEIVQNEVCGRLLEIRSIHYQNVVNQKLQDYTLPEWIVCLEEEILLEYAVPIFSKVLFHYPMLSGMNKEWEILYLITKIKDEFWRANEYWKKYYKEFVTIQSHAKQIKYFACKEYFSLFYMAR